MKLPALFLTAIIAFSCAPKKDSITTLVSDCPAAGTCHTEILTNKSLEAVTDNLGRVAYTLGDTIGTDVAKYKYEKTKNPAYQDDFYSEEVAIEISSQPRTTDISNLRVFFTVTCFCRGKAGTYRVKGSKAVIKGKILTLTLPPDIIEAQLTKEIKIALN